MTRLFITASGTDSGKTFLIVALTRYLREKGFSVRAVKPVATGYVPPATGFSFDESISTADRPVIAGSFEETDTAHMLAAMGVEATVEEIDRCSPWRFDAPLSPNMAADLEGRTVDFAELTKWCRNVLEGPEDVIFVESTGGAMVPLNNKQTTLDWIKDLEIPTVLVVGSYLGAISHALTAFAALQSPVKAIIINETPGSTVSLQGTAETIARFAKVPVLTVQRQYVPAEWDDVVKLLTT